MNTALSIAQRLQTEGAAVIDVPYGSKNPNRKGWQRERLSARDITERFSGADKNVGILCGGPSNGLTDVDLDCEEAVAVAGLLPPTDRIGGRTSRPHSHQWLIVDDPPNKAATQFKDPVRVARGESNERAMIVEWRSTGGQTIVYGRHPDGDAYLWHKDGPPARVTALELGRRIRHVAVAALAARYWPGTGARHEGALAWSGLLLNCGVPPNDMENIITAAALAAGDDEGEDRATAARTTAERKRAGEAYTGGSTLAGLLGEHGGLIVKQVQKWLLPRIVRSSVPNDDERDEEEPESDDAPAEAPRDEDDAEPRTLADVIETFQRWMHLPDPGSVEVALAAHAANQMDGDPVWLLQVAPPSGGKTAVLNALTRLPDTFMTGTVTESGLLSGSPKREHAKGAKGGLLHQIGPHGHLIIKDFTSIISMHREARAAVLAALREIFDGSWTRHVGSDGGRELHWSGKIGIIAGVTPAIDTAHGVMAAMGERFIMYRLPKGDTDALAERALEQTGDETEMREQLAGAVSGLFAGLDIPQRAPNLDAFTRTRIVTLASLAARARSHVERDPIKREIELVPEPEAPGRLAKSLAGLYNGMTVIGMDEGRRWHILTKIAFDCIPSLRRRAILALAQTEDWLDTTRVELLIRYPNISTRRCLEDLAAHGVVDRLIGKKGEAHKWRLSAWARARYDRIAAFTAEDAETFSEMSGDIGSESADEAAQGGGERERYSPNTIEADISEKVSGDGAREASCWQCKALLTSDGDVTCDSCGWIRCACGACAKGCAGGESMPPVGGCAACGGALGELRCEDCGELVPLHGIAAEVYDLAGRLNFVAVRIAGDDAGGDGPRWHLWLLNTELPGVLDLARAVLRKMLEVSS